jgi:hypothetical protein
VRGSRRVLGLSMAMLVPMTAMTTARSRADTVDECIAANAQVQSLRLQKRLLRARGAAAACARDACPRVVSKECSTWEREIDAAMPSVVIDARDAQGRPLSAAHLLVDDNPVADRLDGAPLEVDPGEHVFRVELDGVEPLKQRVELIEGQRRRVLAFRFASALPEALPPVTLAPPSPTPQPAPPADSTIVSRPVPTASIVLGGVALVALGVFAVEGILGTTQYFDLKRECDAGSAACTSSAKSSDAVALDVATVALPVGVVAAAVSTYFFVTRPSKVKLHVDVNHAGAEVGLSGAF